MHENREISSTPWSEGQGRSAKATSRTADMHVLEKSDCAVVPVNQPNKGGQTSAEVGEGRAQMKENIVQPHMRPTQSEKRMSQGLDGVRKAGAAMLVDVPVGASPTGGACSVTTVVIPRPREGRPTRGKLGSKSLRWPGGMPGQIRQGGQQIDRP
jgi:hypothetical protein